MKAILLKQEGDAGQLYIGEYPMPEVGAEEILIRVQATALNRADILQRQGNYPPPPGASAILGLEVAGIVEQVGPGVTQWKSGDNVMALLAGGGYAEYAVAHEGLAMPIPEGWTFEQAACIPEAFITAWQALHLLANTQPGENVLVHAGASGVGVAAIQLATQLLGARCMATASASKHALCLELGAERAVDYRHEDFAAAATEWTAGRGVDVIIDFIGAPYWRKNLESLALDGRLVILAMMGGAVVEGNMPVGAVLRKRLAVMGSTLRNRTLEYKIELVKSFWCHAAAALHDGRLQPVIDQVFDWTEVAHAHAKMESNSNQGKIVLIC